MSKTIQFPGGKKTNNESGKSSQNFLNSLERLESNQGDETHLKGITVVSLYPTILYWQNFLNGQCEDKELQVFMEAAAAFVEKYKSVPESDEWMPF